MPAPTPLRQDYAARMLRLAGVEDPPLQHAFATVARENFLPPPPWTVLDSLTGPRRLTAAEVAPLYDDVLVVLDGTSGRNNGSPSLHALMLHHLGVRPGDRVVQVGAGGGYYTAILAELAGPAGSVTALEISPRLAALARAALRPWPQVRVIEGDGADWPQGPVQRLYVNAAVADIPARWTENLTVAGVLVLPLGACPRSGWARYAGGHGAVLACTRTAAGIAVRYLTGCAFVCAEGPLGGSETVRQALAAAFAGGGVTRVRSLRRPPPSDPARCWFATDSWALCTDPVEEPAAA
jgi:protein-L-isoaspartate(D-aspartate) O-methyltransferase